MTESMPVTLEGAVERITFYNSENGFGVVRLRVRGKSKPVAVVGTLPAVQPGELLVLTGRWRVDPRHGAQFEPASAEIARPTDAAGIVLYLGSGMVRQIGPVLAKRIVAVFGDHTLDVLDATPGRVREVPGIGPQRAEAIERAWIEHKALRAIVAFLSTHGLDPRYAPRLIKAYGPDAPRILAANPYRLVAEVPGLGFAAADRLGSAIGIRDSSPGRLQAAVHAALLRAAERGHTRMDPEILAATTATVAHVDRDLIEAAIAQQLAAGVVAYRAGAGIGAESRPLMSAAGLDSQPRLADVGTGTVRIYAPAQPAARRDPSLGIGLYRLCEAEEDLSARVRGLARRLGLPTVDVDRVLGQDREMHDLSPEQRAAVRDAATSSLFVLTGGPGVGKTTTTRALVRLLSALGRSVALAAPTGKAAKRLGDVVGVEARTLHRMLGSGSGGFRHGPREPLPFDVVVVDECSMLDTMLARALVRAIGPKTQLVLVGDADQLPSVGPGQVLRDLLSSERVHSAALTTVFRQAAESRIVTNAHRIRRGQLPELDDASGLARGLDCVFVPARVERVAGVGAEWAAHLLPAALGVSPGEVQALAPLTRVCQALNGSLQAWLNPRAPGKTERPHGALALRLGDRVIQTRNNYDLGVFNGDSGTVAALDADDMVVDFGDDRAVHYDGDSVLDLDHAYCLTVHRAQGSEWPGVVVLASSQYGPMLSRNLLYTAITRARRAVAIVGDRQAIARAVAETRDMARCTGLATLLADDSGARIDA
jgi:exodeoxyribonuclease V alpha subunit